MAELTLDEVRDDGTGLYVVCVHCADCDELLMAGKKMTGVDMAKDWVQIVASSPLCCPKCPKGCIPTASDCNAHTKLRIIRYDLQGGD